MLAILKTTFSHWIVALRCCIIIQTSLSHYHVEMVSTLMVLCEDIPPIPDRFPSQKTSDAELWSFSWGITQQTVEQTVILPVIWDAITVMYPHCNITDMYAKGPIRYLSCNWSSISFHQYSNFWITYMSSWSSISTKHPLKCLLNMKQIHWNALDSVTCRIPTVIKILHSIYKQ